MAKNITLKNPNDTSENLYPVTKASLLIDDNGDVFTPQQKLTVSQGYIALDGDPTKLIPVNLRINGVEPTYDSVTGRLNWSLTAGNNYTVIDHVSNDPADDNALVNNKGIYQAINILVDTEFSTLNEALAAIESLGNSIVSVKLKYHETGSSSIYYQDLMWSQIIDTDDSDGYTPTLLFPRTIRSGGITTVEWVDLVDVFSAHHGYDNYDWDVKSIIITSRV